MSESRRSGSAHFTSSLLQAEAFNYISLLASSCRWYKLPQLVSFFLSRAVRKPSVTQLLSAFHLKRWGENHLSILLPFSCFFVPGPLGVSRNRMEWIFEIRARNRGGLLLDKSVGTLCKKTRWLGRKRIIEEPGGVSLQDLLFPMIKSIPPFLPSSHRTTK